MDDWEVVGPLKKRISCREFLLFLQEGFVKKAEKQYEKVARDVSRQLEIDFPRMHYTWNGEKLHDLNLWKTMVQKEHPQFPHLWPLVTLLSGQQVFAQPYIWLVTEVCECEKNMTLLTNSTRSKMGIHFKISETHVLHVKIENAFVLMKMQDEDDDNPIVYFSLKLEIPLDRPIDFYIQGEYQVTIGK
jgi:hypothetical protein